MNLTTISCICAAASGVAGADVVVFPADDCWVSPSVNGPEGQRPRLEIKNAVPGGDDFSRKVYLRFDLSVVDVGVAGSPSLVLTFAEPRNSEPKLPEDPVDFRLFGLLDGDIAEGWSEDQIFWETAPANVVTSASDFEASRTVLLAEFSVDPKDRSVDASISIDLSALFLTDSDDSVTLMISASEQNSSSQSYVETFASGEASFGAPELRFDPACQDADIASPFGVLNFFDVSRFVDLYVQQQPSADLAEPFGVLNFFDVAAYISFYNLGCP